MVSVEPFVYGNIKVSPNLNDYEQLFPEILKELKTTIDKRNVSSLWNIAENLRIIQNSNFDVKFLEFVREIFNIFDSKFESDYSEVDVSNIVIIKVYITMNIKYSVICMESFDEIKNSDTIAFYYTNFVKEDLFNTKHSIVYNISMISDFNPWAPNWSINHIKGVNDIPDVDVHMDHYFLHPKIIYTKIENILDKIIERLTFLSEVSPSYFNVLETNYLYEYSKYVYENYPFCEIVKYYKQLSELSSNIYIPEILNDMPITQESLFISLLTKKARSYFLGFPYISGGTISPKMEKQRLKMFLENREEFYSSVIEKNTEIIQSKILEDTIANAQEESEYMNVLFTPVSSYNIDDTMVILSGGVTFMFTFPEYENIIKQGTNPYTREELDFATIYMMKCSIEVKKNMSNFYVSRGFTLELNDNMQDDFQSNFEKSKILHINTYSSTQRPFHHINFGPIINDFLFGQMRL